MTSLRPRLYLYEKGLFPTGRCIVEVEGSRIFEIHPDPSESVWMDDGDLPDLRVMELRTDGDSELRQEEVSPLGV